MVIEKQEKFARAQRILVATEEYKLMGNCKSIVLLPY